ncbi:MAG: GNAT family N-acetyltransferase [Clostridiales bacterium]|jgi:predicted GNAT family acetyltransferase|nr:GNAT family N-acetyltransferase [Clostridiales bacterium]
MRFKQYNDVKEFYKDTFDTLMLHEAQNLIPLGNIIIGNEGKDKTDWRDPANWFMATVSDETRIKLTAIMTPPKYLTLYATNNIIDENAFECLINEIAFSLPGVMTEKLMAENFAKKYSAMKNVNFSTGKNMRVHELHHVNDVPSVGSLRPMHENDMSFLPYWVEGFHKECFDASPTVQEIAEYNANHISDGNTFILEDNGTPVSTAKISRAMQNICGIAQVYTPPYFRGKGYATSCVAGVSRIVLQRGYSKCVLYTDLANPTSNSIYKKIGYEPVCDSSEIRFGD